MCPLVSAALNMTVPVPTDYPPRHGFTHTKNIEPSIDPWTQTASNSIYKLLILILKFVAILNAEIPLDTEGALIHEKW